MICRVLPRSMGWSAGTRIWRVWFSVASDKSVLRVVIAKVSLPRASYWVT